MDVIGVTFQGFQDWAVIWLPIIFMGAHRRACSGLTLRLMPSAR